MTELSKEPSPTGEGTLENQISDFCINAMCMFFGAAATYNLNAKNKRNVEIEDPKVKLFMEAIDSTNGKTGLILGAALLPLSPLFVCGAKILTETTSYMIKNNHQKNEHRDAKKIDKFFIGISSDSQKWITLLENVFREIFVICNLHVCFLNFPSIYFLSRLNFFCRFF